MSDQTQKSDAEKRKLIQQQLVLLVHAERCQKRESDDPSVAKCTLPRCGTMREVLNHMTDCKMDENCDVPLCSSSRQILSHHENCTCSECDVCSPVRRAKNENAASTSSSAMDAQANAKPAHNPPTADKVKLIRQQLVLILHAYKCQQRERDDPNVRCTLPLCGTMKAVQNHMNTCKNDKDCAVPHCTSSRHIINHWKNCNRAACRVCLPLRRLGKNKNDHHADEQLTTENPPTPNDRFNDSTGLEMSEIIDILENMSLNSLPQTTKSQLPDMETILGTIDPDINVPNDQNQPLNVAAATKDWQNVVTQELRNHLVKKLVTAICPKLEMVCLLDKRLNNLVAYAKKVEAEFFSEANSRSEYYHLLAEKIFRITKELEEKRDRRRKEIAMGNVGTTPPQASQSQSANVYTFDGFDDDDETEITDHDQGKPLFVTATKDWHNTVTCDLRNHLVHKLVQGMSPNLPKDPFYETVWANMVVHAKKLERDFYVVADSRADYYNLIAQKIYEIQKELEKKREKQRVQQMGLNYGATTSAMAIELEQSEQAVFEKLSQLKSDASNLNTNTQTQGSQPPIEQDDLNKIKDEIDDDWMIIDNEQ